MEQNLGLVRRDENETGSRRAADRRTGRRMVTRKRSGRSDSILINFIYIASITIQAVSKLYNIRPEGDSGKEKLCNRKKP